MQLFPSVHVTPSLHVLYLGSKIVKNIFYYFWLDVQIYRGHTLTLISALGGHYTTKIVKNIFYYFWLDVQIYRGHTLTLISALGGGGGGHYTTIKCNYFPACM